jgi:glycosyltransferase involved in cell wall biosynthesis
MRRALPDSVVVADIRGIWPEEFLHARGYDDPAAAAADPDSLAGYRAALVQMSHALKGSDGVLTVSQPLVDWIDAMGLPRPDGAVVPCCVTNVTFDAGRRARVRVDLGLSDKIVLAYAGSITRYQHIEDGFARFCRIALDRLGPERVHVLGITEQPEMMRDVLTAAGIPSRATTIRSLPQARVHELLIAADAGFLLRDASAVNRVSVPVKLGEYLAAGVPVIVSRIEQWVGGLFGNSSAALIVDWFGTSRSRQEEQVDFVLQVLSTEGDVRRRQALGLCEHAFLWSAHVSSIRRVYASALLNVSGTSRSRGSTAQRIG